MSKCVLYEYVYMYVYCLCLYVCMYFCKYVCIIWNVRVYECMCICVQAPSKVMCFNFYLCCVNVFLWVFIRVFYTSGSYIHRYVCFRGGRICVYAWYVFGMWMIVFVCVWKWIWVCVCVEWFGDMLEFVCVFNVCESMYVYTYIYCMCMCICICWLVHVYVLCLSVSIIINQ